MKYNKRDAYLTVVRMRENFYCHVALEAKYFCRGLTELLTDTSDLANVSQCAEVAGLQWIFSSVWSLLNHKDAVRE